MVDFGSGKGRSELATAGEAELRRGSPESENTVRGLKMPFVDGHWSDGVPHRAFCFRINHKKRSKLKFPVECPTFYADISPKITITKLKHGGSDGNE